MIHKKIKVAHLTSVHPIDDVRIFVKQCTSLFANGFDVTLIACGDRAFEDIQKGVKRISLNVPVKSRLQRIRKRSKAVLKKALEIDADIYHFHDPELMGVGHKLKRLGKKVIFDSHEDVVSDISTKKYIPFLLRKTLAFFYKRYEKYVVAKLDGVVTVTPHIVNRLKKINPNTVQVANFPIVTEDNLDETLKRKNLAFAGNISQTYLLENVINAISDIDGANMILAGNADTGYLSKLQSLEGWKKVNYLGVVPHETVKTIYKNSLIGIACLAYTANTGFRKGSLGVLKLFEFMNAGMAVVCSDSELWKEIIDKEKCGIYVNPYDVIEIKKAVELLISKPQLASSMGFNGRKAVEREYNWQKEEIKLLNLYNNL
ncbi:MAG TPA: glycosyltransferase [Bacteroidales bacterium]|nr:glycosyltransferase [Bacteroidales bacterium]